MRAAIYARYSSENQREQSIEDQVRVCRQFADRNGISLAEQHIYADEAVSGSTHSRPGLNALKKAAEAKRFDLVIVDDASRLSRDNQQFNMTLIQLKYWGLDLVSVSDGLDSRDEHAKFGYQLKAVFNEMFLDDLKKKTHRGQVGQVLRGFNVGARRFGYLSEPTGATKCDNKGRLRSEGFKLVISPDEARVVQRIFKEFIDGKSVTWIVKTLNDEHVPTKNNGRWNASTISRILKNEKYVGSYVWNRNTNVRDPMSGKRKTVERSKEDWIVHQREDMRIISDDVWTAAQQRWREIAGVFPIRKGRRGFEGKQRSYVETHPPHLLSGSLLCGACGGAIVLVGGKKGGYYGCHQASRRACANRTLISRKRLERNFVDVLCEKLLKPEVLEQVYARTAKKIAERSAHLPAELRLKRTELAHEQSRVHNIIEFIATGRATPGLADALGASEEKVKRLHADVASLEATKADVFEPPPREWIVERLKRLDALLEAQTEASALAVRRLTGPITLTPETPEVGRPYYRAACKFETLNLLQPLGDAGDSGREGPDRGSNLSQWWRWRESNPRPESVDRIVYVRSRWSRRQDPDAHRRVCLSFQAAVPLDLIGVREGARASTSP